MLTASALLVAALAYRNQVEATRAQVDATRDQIKLTGDQLQLNREERERDRRRFAARVAVFSPEEETDVSPEKQVAGRIQNRSPANITGMRVLFSYRRSTADTDGTTDAPPVRYDRADVSLIPPCTEVEFTAGDIDLDGADISELGVVYASFVDANGVRWETTPAEFAREWGKLDVSAKIRHWSYPPDTLISVSTRHPKPLEDCGEGA